jgi:anthraniloyl-CoA monooxygenase
VRIVTIGGGPAGLYFALLLKKARPDYHITVLERNRAGDTFGWGVVFSDQTLGNFYSADRETYQAITDHFAHWDDIDVHIKGRTITSGGHGFCGIARKTLLQLLYDRAVGLGVEVRFECDIPDLETLNDLGLDDADLIVAADGVNSRIRKQYAAQFQPTLDVRSAKYIWLGTTKQFEAFTFCFVENEFGVFQAHCYRFEPNLSTFIVECDADSWKRAGFDTMDTAQTILRCERMFAQWLDGHALISNATHRLDDPWTSFVRISNKHWYTENIVLIGDAAHTAHFSIGSGTKLAMEDAIALAKAVASAGTLTDPNERAAALQRYQDERMVEALRLQNAARNSMEWFEHVKRYMRLEPEQFAYSLLTRSQRVSHENLRLRDATYLSGVERWVASVADAQTKAITNEPTALHIISNGTSPHDSLDTTPPPPPLFTPYRLRDMHLINRIAVAPMDMYRAVDGTPQPFHYVHLGSRAIGGAALVFTEMTCVSPEGRITPGCTGMYNDAHRDTWKEIVDFVHSESQAKICLQLGHSGRKGSVKVPWEGNNVPLDQNNWEVIAPSPIPYTPQLQTPRPMTRRDMDLVREQFARAAYYAIECNFDMLELHCAHGYLLSSFITPLTNQRNDEYGGSLANRLRYPLEIFSTIRDIWPSERPISVRISATDWADGGITGDDAVEIARAFVSAGADIIHVSTGQTVIEEQPVYGRMFQTPYSDQIRNEAGIRTIAVGNILDPDQVNAIIAAGRADLVALGRPHLSNPYWTLHAAAELGYQQQPWPHSYFQGRRQLEREIERRKSMAASANPSPPVPTL